jgi:hypothetical protein
MKIFIKTLLLVQRPFLFFCILYILLPGASLLSNIHIVLDGGPRYWTYKDPNKPMTYQQIAVLNRIVYSSIGIK